jgi:hypothetical protein
MITRDETVLGILPKWKHLKNTSQK